MRERVVRAPDVDDVEMSLLTRELQHEHVAMVMNAKMLTAEEIEHGVPDEDDPVYVQRRREEMLKQVRPGLPPTHPEPKKLSLFMQKQLGLI